MKLCTMEEITAVALCSLSAGHGLQKTLDDIRACSGLQFIAVGLSGGIITHSMGEDKGRLWGYALEADVLPQSVSDSIRLLLEGKHGSFGNDCPAFLERIEGDNHFYMCGALFLSGKPDGIVFIRFADRDMRQTAEAVAELVPRLYSYFAGASAVSGNYDDDFWSAGVARELLLQEGNMAARFVGGVHNPESGGLSTEILPGYAIVAARGLGGNLPLQALYEAERVFSRYVPRSFHLVSGTTILAFIHGLDTKAFAEDGPLLKQLQAYAGSYHLYCGVSHIFDSLSQRRGFRSQAILALQRGVHESPGDYVFLAGRMYSELIIAGALERVGSQLLILSEIRVLARYDAESQTEHIRTLECYLACGNRSSQAASELFIDRSTLKYRLQKIKDIIKTDFENQATANRLSMGIAVFRLAKP